MVEVVILIPKRYNNGSKIERKILNSIEDKLLEEFGGFTETQPVKGKWKGDDGNTYIDISARYEIAIDPADVEKFKELANKAGKLTKQIAIYIKIDGKPDILTIE